MTELSNAQIKDAYNRLAPRLHARREIFNLRPMYSALRRNLPERGRVLDLGCGSGGVFTTYFLQDGWEVIGYDFSEAMLELVRRHTPKMRTVRCDLRDFIPEPDSCQAVISTYTMFHLTVPEQLELMKKIYVALEPGGEFFFNYGNCGAAELLEKMIVFMDEKLYCAALRPDLLKRHLIEIGFQIVSVARHTISKEAMLWCAVRKPPRP